MGLLRGVVQKALERYVPPRGVSARVSDIIANPKVKRGLLSRMDKGLAMGAGDWYDASELRNAFHTVLPADQADARFKLYMDMVAASSPQSTVPMNVRNASYYYKHAIDGTLPQEGKRNPNPYGHMAANDHQKNARYVDENGGWDALQNPKVASFVENLTGNELPVTVDTHAMRLPAIIAKDPRFLSGAFTLKKGEPSINPQKLFKAGELSLSDALDRPKFWAARPNNNEYGALEKYYQELAAKKGITPAQAQAAAWVGGGDITGVKSMGGTFMDFFKERAAITAQERGESVGKVIEDFITGKAPLLGIPLGAVALSQLDGSGEEDAYA